jgi:hypothetical protein
LFCYAIAVVCLLSKIVVDNLIQHLDNTAMLSNSLNLFGATTMNKQDKEFRSPYPFHTCASMFVTQVQVHSKQTTASSASNASSANALLLAKINSVLKG